jgi:glycosyltransferase involved in cell wall biosynthesis
MEAERAIINVVNSLGPGSAPLNGFAAYRARKFAQEKHFVISFAAVDEAFLREAAELATGGNLTILDCKGSVVRLARLSRALIRSLRSQFPQVVVHLHHHRSGLLFHLIRPVVGGTPSVLFTVRNSFEDYALPAKLLACMNFLLASAVTFVGGASYRAFPAPLRRLRAAAAHAIPNGADLERIDKALAEVAATSSDGGSAFDTGMKLLCVARFVRQKNHRFLIQLLSELPAGFTLVLVGEGVLRQQVLRWAKEAGVEERVIFTGLIPRDAVYDEMSRADVFVSTSCWEGLPVAALEAMATKLPLVVSDIAPHQEIAAMAPSVKLLPLQIDAWRELLSQWACLPRQELRRIGERNREAVAAQLSLDRMHARYTEIYRSIAE